MRPLLLALMLVSGTVLAQDSASFERCYESDCGGRSEISWPVVAGWAAAAIALGVWLRKK